MLTQQPASSDWPQEDDTHPFHPVLASERGKVRLLAAILSLTEGSDRSQLGINLLHLISERHPIHQNCIRRQVQVGCSCDQQTHTVSILGFLLLKEVVASEEDSILCVERVKARMLFDSSQLHGGWPAGKGEDA